MERRIVVKGTSGVGKSTFAADLAARLGVACIELDALHHGPNWTTEPVEVFRERVRAAMDAAPNGWVIDGNYDAKLDGMVVDPADTIVWLALPLRTTLPRLARRTVHRVRNDVELWNGNRERWRDHLASRESLFVWSVRSHLKQRREWPDRFAGDARVVRLRSEREAQRWLDGVSRGAG